MRLATVAKMNVGLTVLLLAASCGGGVSQEDFAAEANPVCAAVNSDLQGLAQPQSPEELVVYLEGFVKITTDGLAALRTVEPPDGDQDAFDEWTDTLQQVTDKAEEALTAARADDQETSVAALAEVDQLNTAANAMAADLGLDDCA